MSFLPKIVYHLWSWLVQAVDVFRSFLLSPAILMGDKVDNSDNNNTDIVEDILSLGSIKISILNTSIRTKTSVSFASLPPILFHTVFPSVNLFRTKTWLFSTVLPLGCPHSVVSSVSKKIYVFLFHVFSKPPPILNSPSLSLSNLMRTL
eukprot:TRINITY_DN10377_c0_g2_i12.p1 TRINITY_DN10377_c0_g2~~TRINITY_DN10377_c0_g2_i12.p1  ORF type:complete len:149 (+),score=4.65 TRINITY_DN10377_c0_g2_i12:352-798(+)